MNTINTTINDVTLTVYEDTHTGFIVVGAVGAMMQGYGLVQADNSQDSITRHFTSETQAMSLYRAWVDNLIDNQS